MPQRRIVFHLVAMTVLLAVVGLSCGSPEPASVPPALRLATPPTVDSTGLLGEILPDFQETHGIAVEIIIAGTDEALTLGQQGEVDVVLLHAPQDEAQFIEEGFGINRQEVLYNDFVIVGPDTDPAAIGDAQTAIDAFARIADTRALFISPGDDSETHARELAIWQDSGRAADPVTGWYQSLSQDMRGTLIAANTGRAYTFTDRATYISMRDDLPELEVLFGGEDAAQNPDARLRNIYSVIQVNPGRHPDVNAEHAETFIEWITSPDAQESIGEFGLEQFGQPLFVPVAE